MSLLCIYWVIVLIFFAIGLVIFIIKYEEEAVWRFFNLFATNNRRACIFLAVTTIMTGHAIFGGFGRPILQPELAKIGATISGKKADINATTSQFEKSLFATLGQGQVQIVKDSSSAVVGKKDVLSYRSWWSWKILIFLWSLSIIYFFWSLREEVSAALKAATNVFHRRTYAASASSGATSAGSPPPKKAGWTWWKDFMANIVGEGAYDGIREFFMVLLKGTINKVKF